MIVQIKDFLGTALGREDSGPSGPSIGHRMRFFQEFLRRPQQVGALIPSSRFLERRVVEASGLASARTVVELGSGTGGTTRAILKAMHRDARLLSIEINPDFHRVIQRISDPRLIPHLGSALELSEIIDDHQLDLPEVVISGIPFSTMSRDLGGQILQAISGALAPGGRFVAYQFRNRVEALGRAVLGPAKVKMELRNLPPMRVYHWQKNTA